MKLIIDIPEDTHERITRPDRLFTDDDVNKICWAVYNGTPIPDNVPTVDVLEKIRTEIDGIEITGQIDEHTSFIRTGDSVKKIVLEILDKYR